MDGSPCHQELAPPAHLERVSVVCVVGADAVAEGQGGGGLQGAVVVAGDRQRGGGVAGGALVLAVGGAVGCGQGGEQLRQLWQAALRRRGAVE